MKIEFSERKKLVRKLVSLWFWKYIIQYAVMHNCAAKSEPIYSNKGIAIITVCKAIEST